MVQYFDHSSRFSTEEWKARQKLAAMYRIFAYLKWDESIYNHLSLRVPDAPNHFLINPFGLHYSEVTASNLVKVDTHGQIVGHSDWPINPAGMTFHRAIRVLLESPSSSKFTAATADLMSQLARYLRTRPFLG